MPSQSNTASSIERGTEEPEHLDLPTPRLEGGQSLISALRQRHSTREYSDQSLPLPVLSELLWAAFGVNRPNGDRTVPYWRHVMVIDVYISMQDGVWRYEPANHTLTRYLQEDIRDRTGLQDFVAIAPLNLIYVAHGERMADVAPEDRRLYASVDAAFMGQNVYLFCASEGLGTVFLGAVDYAGLARSLRLSDTQFVTFAQTVGYPAA
jgi:nitroreductase